MTEQIIYLKQDGFRIINNKMAEYFLTIYHKDFRLETKEPNCNFFLKNNKPIKIIDIFRIAGKFYIKYKYFEITSYFDNPM